MSLLKYQVRRQPLLLQECWVTNDNTVAPISARNSNKHYPLLHIGITHRLLNDIIYNKFEVFCENKIIGLESLQFLV